MAMADLEGRVALVTGGSRGIGAGIVRRLAAQGADVAFTYQNAEESAERLVKELREAGVRGLAVRADSAEPDEVPEAVHRVARELGGLDILVNNAAVLDRTPFAELTVAGIDRMLSINVRAVILAAQAADGYLPNGGRIINIGSCLAERVPAPGVTLYAVTKAALTGLAKGLARELGPRGITVNNVLPGPTDTDSNPANGPAADMLRSHLAVGRFGTVDEVAATVAHLAGPEAAFITGASIAVDGGFAA
jgi:3-oxoacyl-[acyl-carrier protein] reductase